MDVTFRNIYDIAEKVFENLGSGHSEFAYRRAMEIEFRRSAINYESEKRIVINYIDASGNMYSIGEERLDLYVRTETDEIIIELKETGETSSRHEDHVRIDTRRSEEEDEPNEENNIEDKPDRRSNRLKGKKDINYNEEE